MTVRQEAVARYIGQALEVMQISVDGEIQKDMSKLPEDMVKKLMPVVIEVAKMIQLEERK